MASKPINIRWNIIDSESLKNQYSHTVPKKNGSKRFWGFSMQVMFNSRLLKNGGIECLVLHLDNTDKVSYRAKLKV